MDNALVYIAIFIVGAIVGYLFALQAEHKRKEGGALYANLEAMTLRPGVCMDCKGRAVDSHGRCARCGSSEAYPTRQRGVSA